MKYGLYLQGGGAKGAFQAGALCNLIERGYKFNVVGGTSIGAINGYFLYKNRLEELKALYNNFEDGDFRNTTFQGKTIDNDMLISYLKNLNNLSTETNKDIEHFYVNYDMVNDAKMIEKVEDITKLSSQEAINAVKYSSLLPYNYEPLTLIELAKVLIDNPMFFYNKFVTDLQNHEFDGLNLDGGMLNNVFIKEILNHDPDKVVIIGFGNEEEYAKNMGIKDENRKHFVFITSDREFSSFDTLNFSKDFLRNLFEEGYKKASEITL